MSFGDRIIGGMKAILLIEDQVRRTAEDLKEFRAKAEAKLADHEQRLTRLETIVEIARPDGTVLKIAPPD